jgi:hypothetical protein
MLKAGIRSFVDLTQPRDGLEPYEPLLRRLSDEQGLDVRYARFGVPDMSTPSRDLMARILDYITAEVAEGRPVYIHCWGGVGRTGTVAACFLTRTGLGCQQALDLVGSLFRSLPPSKVARFPEGSPQTDAQRAFVRSWSDAGPPSVAASPVRFTFEASTLVAQHPPILNDANKRTVHSIACPPGNPPRGTLHVSRWPAMPLPEPLDTALMTERVETRPGFFDYGPAAAGTVDWHLNFADPELFGFYSGPLFAQDEMQVAEHPALASLREALRPLGHARTEEHGRPTPVLIAGVERRCRVATDVDAAQGRPFGLYGNAFAAAATDAIARATTRLDPPTSSNIIAIAAPRGQDRYTAAQIEHILTTAFSGFRAAAMESGRLWPGSAVAIHTGFWGCGAFGGNRVLMVALQIAAASLSRIHRLVVHTGPAEARSSVREAEALLSSLNASSTRELIGAIERRGLRWGVSDGN